MSFVVCVQLKYSALTQVLKLLSVNLEDEIEPQIFYFKCNKIVLF